MSGPYRMTDAWRRRRYVAAIGHGLVALAFVLVTVACAKMAQYAAVDTWGRSLGFSVASLAALVPVLLAAWTFDRTFLRAQETTNG